MQFIFLLFDFSASLQPVGTVISKKSKKKRKEKNNIDDDERTRCIHMTFNNIVFSYIYGTVPFYPNYNLF